MSQRRLAREEAGETETQVRWGLGGHPRKAGIWHKGNGDQGSRRFMGI